MDIILKKKRNGDWKAYFSDNKRMCETGATQDEALGKLVTASQYLLGLTIMRED